MEQTYIMDEHGNKYPTTQSHKSGKAVQLRIAELMIEAHGLTCTPEEYVQICIAKTQAGMK